jgi:hypothetical protein
MLFGLPLREATFEVRRFHLGPARPRFEKIGRAFLDGFNTGVELGATADLPSRLDLLDPELKGFSHEGAAMGLAVLDTVLPWGKGRFHTFVNTLVPHHLYMCYVGLGVALGRLGLAFESRMRGLDPVFKWLVLDGYGFAQAFFRPEETVRKRRVPALVTGYAARMFDRGLGRGLWFVECGDPARVSETIRSFVATRHEDLWAGVGLASAYAGGPNESALERLRQFSGEHASALAVGACLAADTRVVAGNPAEHVETACRVHCGMTAFEAHQVTLRAREPLRGRHEIDGVPTYEVMVEGIQREFVTKKWEFLRTI